jgi:DNA helicase HerA-like ATPase
MAKSSSKDIRDEVREGYAFDVPCVELGGLVVDGEPVADANVRVPVAMLNRHGLVAGATGTGKTVTLQLIAEQLSLLGVPSFAADVKGDLSGLAVAGTPNDKITERTEGIGQAWEPTAYPVELLRLADSGTGVPVRATITSFGPTLLSKVLRLNATQESSLGLIFHYADKAGLPLLDIKDLREVVHHLTSDEGQEELARLGGLAKSTAGVILRELINFQAAGGEEFFGEPEFDVHDLLRTDDNGRGVISLLELPGVQDEPILFSTFLMWVLAELFEVLPEVGDVDQPKLVFFFDEAHLLFTDASWDFLEALIQTVRLIRSKGVGVFFVTQTPKDVHEDVLAQLGSRVQHQLRAFTPNDADALKATVKTYPRSPYDLEELLQELGIGEGVVTVMSERGAPTPVAHTMLPAPQSRMGIAEQSVLDGIVAASVLAPKYSEPIDRESAYEMLLGEIDAGPEPEVAEPVAPTPYGAPAQPAGTAAEPSAQPAATTPPPAEPVPTAGGGGMSEAQRIEAEILGALNRSSTTVPAPAPKPRARTSASAGGASMIENFLKTAAESLGKEISRGVFGTRRRR